ncbi:alpha/beta fold hydrolase [Palleronia rufa]|uniref:alpha/beta fold hydrolase n=1 Tax=Palleronia rufa TaxID=1530186 RepID=UPI000567C2C5|nr:alpha/beta hydrolase [Palleronia rufa]
MADPAPLHADIADGPDGGAAQWITTADARRLRVARWNPPGPARGTVLIFQGRTEYIEKYGVLAADLVAAGFTAVAIDWRGQGLSDRLLPDPLSGHVGRFADYQLDVAALLTHLAATDCPQPLSLVAHSMGGAIGLRALIAGAPIRRAVFSAPMWGILIAPRLRPAAWATARAARWLGLTHRYAPGGSARAYASLIPFADNLLTTDPAQFARMARQTEAVPELALGGPSLGWLSEALMECRALAALPSPDTPCLTLLGTDEAIVDPVAVRARMARWPGGDLKVLDGARHECLMEAPSLRSQAMAALIGHLG